MQQMLRSRTLFLLFLLLSPALSPQLCCQPISVRGSIGFAYLPLSDWSDFFGQMKDSYYQKNNPNTYYALSVHYALSQHHSVNIGTELIRTTASLGTSPGGFPSVVDWKFRGIPITIGYEYRLDPFSERFTPVAGAGLSCFFSEVVAGDHFFDVTLTRTGNGYGVHGTLGLIAEITQSISMLTQARYRYANGMAFSGNKGDIKVEFTGFDLSTGVAWTF